MDNPTCHKVAFDHKSAAIQHANAMRKRLKNNREVLRPYDCPLCGKVHLTSQADDPKRARKLRQK